MNRVERLLNLTAALLDTTRPLPFEAIRQRVPGYDGNRAGVRRAYERDKDSLKEMGIPIEYELIDPADPGLGSGYRIHRDRYYLRDPGLAPDELAALHLAATTVRLQGHTGTKALAKLGAAGGPGAGPAVGELPGDEHLGALFGALTERRRATFPYNGKGREVEPHQLSFRSGHWYLSGLDRDAGESRQFRLDRIEGPVAVGDAGAFEAPVETVTGPVAPWQLPGSGDEVQARLHVDADQAPWAVGHLGPEAVEERGEDGSVVLAVAVTNTDAFRSFVLGFLDHAEVLSPPALRDDVIAWLERLASAGGA